MTRTALVTGGTDGIGKAIAKDLATAGLRVLVVGRDEEKGRRAERELREVSGNSSVTFLAADVGVIRDATRLADEVSSIAPELHCLVHGAGIVRGRRVLTADGIESNFAVNYLGRFLLTTRLLPSLLAAGQPGSTSRILMLGGAAQSGTIHFEDPSLTNGFGTIRAVTQFCKANDVFTSELARRLAGGARTTIACLKIGVVKTGIRREFPTWMKVLVPLLMDPLLAKTPEEVAEHALDLLTSPLYEGVTGRHFLLINRFRQLPAAYAADPEMGARLWDLSERLIAAGQSSRT